MRLFTLILSFYVIVLTAIPCIDTTVNVVLQNTELSHQTKDCDHNNDTDRCSPFCTCNCCATSVIFQDYLVQLNCFPFSEKQYFPVSSGFFSDPLATIWQPPKIA